MPPQNSRGQRVRARTFTSEYVWNITCETGPYTFCSRLVLDIQVYLEVMAGVRDFVEYERPCCVRGYIAPVGELHLCEWEPANSIP